MSLIVAVVQSAVPRSEIGTITASVNLVRQVGATVATAIVGGFIGSTVAAMLPAGLDAATLTPAFVRAQDPLTQLHVAEVYRDVFIPIFIALAVVYAVGIVASVLLPNGRLSDEHAPIPDSETEAIAV
jgi:hypothetical protein